MNLTKKHGMSETREYQTWSNIKGRCLNTNNAAYPYYGGRGVTIHPSLLNFEEFLRIVGKRPSDNHSLDRIDNNRGYEPGNMRWATKTQQNRNTRQNRYLTAHGKTQTLAEWSEELGVDPLTISKRIDHYGWTPEEALTKEINPPKKLDPSAVVEIYLSKESSSLLSKRFSISLTQIGRIKSRARCSNLTRDLGEPGRCVQNPGRKLGSKNKPKVVLSLR